MRTAAFTIITSLLVAFHNNYKKCTISNKNYKEVMYTFISFNMKYNNFTRCIILRTVMYKYKIAAYSLLNSIFQSCPICL